jgi:DNA-3-methyladenine glycosylase
MFDLANAGAPARRSLERRFYARDTITVARDLLGRILVRRLPDGARLSGRIVETEAYLGEEDPACHTFGGRRTPRTEPMYGEAGLSYIYFIYGMHHCFNVVTVGVGVPEAVLVRALEPLEGLASAHPRAASGPGKLCRALGLDRRHGGLDLTTNPSLTIEVGDPVSDAAIIAGPRIGIGHSHDAVHWPLRFGIKAHPALSPPRFPSDDE